MTVKPMIVRTHLSLFVRDPENPRSGSPTFSI